MRCLIGAGIRGTNPRCPAARSQRRGPGLCSRNSKPDRRIPIPRAWNEPMTASPLCPIPATHHSFGSHQQPVDLPRNARVPMHGWADGPSLHWTRKSRLIGRRADVSDRTWSRPQFDLRSGKRSGFEVGGVVFLPSRSLKAGAVFSGEGTHTDRHLRGERRPPNPSGHAMT